MIRCIKRLISISHFHCTRAIIHLKNASLYRSRCHHNYSRKALHTVSGYRIVLVHVH